MKSLIALTLASLFAHADVPLTKTDARVLLSGLPKPPAKAVLVGKTLYFAEESVFCPGQNLWSASPKGKPALIATIPCLLSLNTDGQSLVVQSRKDKRVILETLKGNKLVPAKSGLQAFADRMAWLTIYLQRLVAKGGPSLSAEPMRWYWDTASKAEQHRFHFLLKGSGTEPYVGSFLLASRDRSTRNVTKAPGIAGLNIDNAEMAASSGRLYFSGNFGKENTGSIMVLSEQSGKLDTALGTQTPHKSDWQEKGGSETFLRSPKFLSPTADGFFIAERTPMPGESEFLAYYDHDSGKFTKLNIPGKDVAGIHYVNEGLLISKPRSRSIVWYGDPNGWSGAEEWEGKASTEPEGALSSLFFKEEMNGKARYSLRTAAETISLGEFQGIQSTVMGGDSLAVIATRFTPNLTEGHLSVSLKLEDENDLEVYATNEPAISAIAQAKDFFGWSPAKTVVETKSPTLYLFHKNRLVLARTGVEGTGTSVDKIQADGDGGFLLTFLHDGKLYDGYALSISADGRKIELVQAPKGGK